MKTFLPFVCLVFLTSLIPSSPIQAEETSKGTWVRNTSPGPGHVENPGPWKEGQGSDRTEWVSFFRVSPVNPKFMLMGTDLGRAVYTNTRLKGTEFVPVDLPLYLTSTAAFHPTDPKTGYILFLQRGAPDLAGWWRTEDEGESWQHLLQVDASRGGKQLLEVDPHPERQGHLYVGTPKRGLMRSTDNGKTWETIAFEGQSIFTLAMAKDGSSLYVIPGDQQWRLPNDGNQGKRGGHELWRLDKGDASTLQKVASVPKNSRDKFFDVTVHPEDAKRGMVIQGGVLKSFAEGGTTFEDLGVEDGGLTMARYNPANPKHFFVTSQTSIAKPDAFRWSTDGGATWNSWQQEGDSVPALTDYAPANAKSPGYHYLGYSQISKMSPTAVQGRLVFDFVPGDPDGDGVADSIATWGTSWQKGPLMSHDAGATFKPFAHGGNFKEAVQIDYGQSDDRIAIARTEYGVQLSDNGGRSWIGHTQHNTPGFPQHLDEFWFTSKSCWGVAFDPTNDDILIATVSSLPSWIMRTEDFGKTWKKVGEYTDHHNRTDKEGALFSDGRVHWSKANPQRVYISNKRSDDGGRTFPTKLSHTVAAVHPNNADVLVAKHSYTRDCYFFSKDGGQNWVQLPATPASKDRPSPAVKNTAHLNVAIDPRPEFDPGKGKPLRFLAGGEGGVWEFISVNDTGATGEWSLIPNSATVPDPWVEKHGKEIWLGNVMFNDNPGAHHEVYAMPEMPFRNNIGRGEALYRQLYKSEDYGKTWFPLTDEKIYPGDLPNYFYSRAMGASPGGKFSFVDFAGLYTLLPHEENKSQPQAPLSAQSSASE